MGFAVHVLGLHQLAVGAPNVVNPLTVFTTTPHFVGNTSISALICGSDEL